MEVQLLMNDKYIEANEFRYLGYTINNKLDSNEEIKTRTVMARTAFVNINEDLCRRQIHVKLRL